MVYIGLFVGQLRCTYAAVIDTELVVTWRPVHWIPYGAVLLPATGASHGCLGLVDLNARRIAACVVGTVCEGAVPCVALATRLHHRACGCTVLAGWVTLWCFLAYMYVD